jgi:hypothetical protein
MTHYFDEQYGAKPCKLKEISITIDGEPAARNTPVLDVTISDSDFGTPCDAGKTYLEELAT